MEFKDRNEKYKRVGKLVKAVVQGTKKLPLEERLSVTRFVQRTLVWTPLHLLREFTSKDLQDLVAMARGRYYERVVTPRQKKLIDQGVQLVEAGVRVGAKATRLGDKE